jgi:nicotinamide-nucleotide amidase
VNASPSPLPDLRAEIVSIGTELLLGEITDTNARFLASRLPALGITLHRIQQVGDNLLRIQDTLRAAWDRSPLLILTGGLGPTEDDLTREAISGVLGETMVVRPDLEEHLRAYFARRGREMPERNLKQATVIASCEVLPNPVGTAPGWFVRKGDRMLVTMPGVPAEMYRMWSEQAEPRLRAMAHGGVIVSRTLKILGIGESTVEERLGEIIHGANPTAATYARQDGIHVRLAARAADASIAQALIAPVETQVRQLFGNAVYGTDEETLNDVVAHLLLKRNLNVCLVEAGLGGALCTALNGDGLVGGLVLPPISRITDREGMADSARTLIARARQTFDADIAVGVCLAALDTTRLLIAMAIGVRDDETVVVEEHAAGIADGPRRAVLITMQTLREKFVGPIDG